jgi:hypothetical protein
VVVLIYTAGVVLVGLHPVGVRHDPATADSVHVAGTTDQRDERR